MMRFKTGYLALLILWLLPLISFSQTFVYETFESGQMPPPGWLVDGFSPQWAVTNSQQAGGELPEGVFNWLSDQGTARLISPVIDLTGFSSVKLSFFHYYDLPSNPAPSFGVATRNSYGDWHVVYQVTPTAPIGPEKLNLTINNGDVGNPDFQFCIFLTGNFFNMYHYYFDNILLYHPLPINGALVSLASTHPYLADPDTVKGTLLNAGSSVINTAAIQWQLDDGQIFTTNLSGLSLQPEQTCHFACNGLMMAPLGTHRLKVKINSINGNPDGDPGNDTLSKQIFRISHLERFRPLHEEFTSSTCFPCASFNQDYVPWCEVHQDDITLIKYQMNFPGTGDPYYTPECGVREDYYAGYFVPDLYHRGKQGSTDIESVMNDFTTDMNLQGRMKIAAVHSLDFHTIRVKATVLPFDNLGACRLHIAVMEKVTHNNARNNGETSFEHVMMKMIPDAFGTLVNLSDRIPVTVTDTVDLTGTHVEEWNDLIVGVFVQNYQTREIYQSGYTEENGILGTEARLSAIYLDGQLLPGFSPDQFSYTVYLPAGSQSAPVVTATPVDPMETIMILPDYQLPGTTGIDVFARDLVAFHHYSVQFMVQGVGLNIQPDQDLRIYPNPSAGLIHISCQHVSQINLLDRLGRNLWSVNDPVDPNLDLCNFNPGIYFVEFRGPNHLLVRKKFVLIK